MSEPAGEGLSYVDALNELRVLVEQLSSEQDIDQLAKEVSRAKVLIDFCRSRISNAEIEINQILSDGGEEESI
ncbi:MAG: exodeoxyribonuclease VII small subunit [Actinomycetota bacterium]|nr:exodeoxyribonuclease VII small subunit [Actinomycetota bacterium]